MSRILRLTSEAFADFGHVARAGQGLTKSIRGGTAMLTKSAATFAHDEAALDLALDFYAVKGEAEALRATQAERHSHSAQMFVPMSVDRYLVVVWRDHPERGGSPEIFLAGPEDVVIYNPGVWHHGIVAVGGDAVFASTMWRTRGGTDAEFITLPLPLEIDLRGAVL